MGVDGWPSRSTSCAVWYYLGPFLAASVTGLRLFVRVKKVGWKKLAVDDILVLLATCLLIAQCVVGLTVLIPNGLGKPIDSLPSGSYSNYLKGQYITLFIGLFSITTPKIAILAYYYRVFITRTFRKFIIGTITCILAATLGILIALILICQPISYTWNRDIPGKCFNFRVFIFIINLLHMSLNAWIFLLPIPIIARLRATRSRKVILGSIFLVGLSTLGLGVGRIIVSTSEAEDRTYRGIYLAIFNVLESVLHIFCCNLPIIFYLFVYGINKVRPTTKSPKFPRKPSAISSLTIISHKRINSKDSADSFDSFYSNNSGSSGSSGGTDYWVRLCNSYILNDMAPRTVICAGDSTPFNTTIAAHYDDNDDNDDNDDDDEKSDPLKFDLDADVERIAGRSKHKHHSSKTVLPKDGIVVKQEIVQSVTYKGDSWNGY